MDHKGVLSLVVVSLAVSCDVNVATFHQGRESGSTRWNPWMGVMPGLFDPGPFWASPWVTKRSAPMTKKSLEIMIKIDRCHFDAYDISGDGVITLDEMQILFFGNKIADELFKALDLTTADDRVTKEEFEYMAPRTIADCETTTV